MLYPYVHYLHSVILFKPVILFKLPINLSPPFYASDAHRIKTTTCMRKLLKKTHEGLGTTVDISICSKPIYARKTTGT